MSYSLFNCVLCDKKMHGGTHPYWIIDPETLEVMGLAHSTCRGKLKMADMRLQFSTSVAFWGSKGPVAKPPIRKVIEFTAKMIRFRASLPPWKTDLDFRVLVLLGNTFTKATSVDELFALPDVHRMVEWWKNPENINMSDEELDTLKRRLKEGLAD